MDLEMMVQKLLPGHIGLAPDCHDLFDEILVGRHLSKAGVGVEVLGTKYR